MSAAKAGAAVSTHAVLVVCAACAGPLLECVVWHDGEVWRAALDTSDLYEPESGEGALADCPPLTNFRVERQVGHRGV